MILSEDKTYYRMGNSTEPLGQWYTEMPYDSVAQARIDLAIREQWIDPSTGALGASSILNTNYAIKIPAGTTVYYGPVGYQDGIYLGGQNIIQTYINDRGISKTLGPLVDRL
jgi:hypothetical protein